MCGIVGFWDSNNPVAAHTLRDTVMAMAASLRHRGPDDGGAYVDAPSGLAFGHRRLAIIDLSDAGHQPMVSACGRYVLSYNGELYNHGALRKELERRRLAPAWVGHSDTETMLGAFAALGVEATLQMCVGMFALALWDKQARVLTLARDRMGEKPLYFGQVDDAFVFASELKALRRHPKFKAEVDRDVLRLYLRYNCTPAPLSIYRGIRKLPPGTTLTLSAPAAKAKPVAYWSLLDVAERGQREPFAGTDAEAVDEVERLLRQSVAGQMVADVPIGAFLSGGIDSSAVVAMMQTQSAQPVHTFTIGVGDTAFNEATEAKKVAEHLGTTHTEHYVSPAEAMAVITRLPEIYDEPFADSSQIPTFLVSQLARREVTVALSGDGGDELFGGYNRHYWAAHVWRRLRFVPRPLRRVLANAMHCVPPNLWDGLLGRAERFLPTAMRHRNPGDKLHKLADMIDARGADEMYMSLVSHWKTPSKLVRGGAGRDGILQPVSEAGLDCFESRMMYLDTVTYLPDDILTKVDRAAMAVSLETRIPMLDHRLVEFAWRLPLEMKIRGRTGKWLLRQALYRHVPQQLVERPKAGFGLPLAEWLRGPLRDWAENLLDERRLGSEGYFHPTQVRDVWAEHLRGGRNQAYKLWDVLMFQAWLDAEARHG